VGKKASVLLLFVLISGLVSLIWFIQRGTRNIITDPYSVIPGNAALIIESVDLPGLLGSITEENEIFPELASIREAGNFTKKIVFLRDFIESKPMAVFFERNKSVISFQNDGRGKIVPLMSMNLPPQIRYRNIFEALSNAAGIGLAQEKLEKKRIIVIPYILNEEKDTLFVAYNSGLLICTPSKRVLEKAVAKRDPADDIRKAPGFSKIMGAAGKREDKVFIIFKNFSEIIRSVAGGKNKTISDEFSRLAGSAEGDVFINRNGIILSGYTETADSAEYLFRFKSGSSGKLRSADVLPAEVILFETEFLPDNKSVRAVSVMPGDSTRKFAIGLTPYLGNEITHAFLRQPVDTGTSGSVVIYQLKNRDMAERLISSEYSAERYFQPDDQIRIPVYNTRYRNIAGNFLPRFTAPSNDTLITFIDNFMITGSSFYTLSEVLYANILNKTLANDLPFRDFEATLPSRAGYYFYCVPSAIIGYLSGQVNDSVVAFLERNIRLLKKIQAVGYQFAPSNGMIYNTISVKFGETKDKTGAEWETLLDSSACIKPFFFTNHNTGAKEIFIQDLKNNCYLVNSAGRVLWKVMLNERIQGEVFMIDYYGNGKFQLLFSGKNWLHLLDRNGNYVERFPVRLRSPASAPASLFDYDGTRDYRILVPGEDRYIYAYDKSGNVVKGWKPFRTNGIVTSAVRFFRVSGKDYLVASDNITLYFLDRTGNIRLGLKEPIAMAPGSEIRLFTGQQQALVLSSVDGLVEIVGFDGKLAKISLGKFGSDHSFDFFDVDGDGYGEYVFIDKGILYLYDNDKSVVFSRNFGSENTEGPINFVFSSTDRKIGLFDNSKKLIYLVDRKGNTMKGFPLRGASAFSIGKLSDRNEFHLIVGGEDNFLYNYKLESGDRQ
jgi:WD40 repeat protein